MARKIKTKGKVKKRLNNKISFKDFVAPTHESIKEEIKKKVGIQPKRPTDLQNGNWTEQSLKVLKERYLMKDNDLNPIETPEDMIWRVSWEIASSEARWGSDEKQVMESARDFYNLMISRKFMPNSPTLMNAGTGNGLQYSACFVLPVEDSMEGIFDALKYQAIIHKTGGGTGFSFNRLRPFGSIVKTSSGTASGPVSFMRIFDASTNEVKQGGKRRGANMGILRVDHPDILEFIHCKEEGGITNFNISVGITDKFMQAYKNDEGYELVDPRTNEVMKTLSAREVFDEIADGAHRTGDPGLIFLDKMNRGSSNPVPSLGPIEATNPCGEQMLYPYDACNLGSIFLTYFVKDEKGLSLNKRIDWEGLKEATRIATRFLDNVIEVNPYPLEEIRKTVHSIRRIGLGIGGWADMLLSLGIPYDSQKALDLAGKVMKTIQKEAVSETQKLAISRGAFPLFENSIYKNKTPRRNSTVTTIAPTGTISIIAGSSSGIEPLFAIAYQHIVKDKHFDRKMSFINPYFEEVAKSEGFWSPELMDKVSEHGVVRGLTEIPEKTRKVFGTSHEIDPIWHIKTQSIFQKYTENAVSKTINLRHDVTVDDVKDAYIQSWESECKGVTVFRDGCKDAQVLNLGVKDKAKNVEEIQDVVVDEDPLRQRPYVVTGSTYKMGTPVGTAFVTINEDTEGQPLEVFINVGKAGSDVAAMAEALGRTISTSLKFKGGVTATERAREFAEQLAGIGGRRSIGFGPTKIRSLPDAVAGALSIHYKFGINGYHLSPQIFNGDKVYTNGQANTQEIGTEEPTKEETEKVSGDLFVADSEKANESDYLQLSTDQTHAQKPGDICPSCGASALVFQEGCSKCHACGHSEC
ncbi:vitamin B12-dependent ribonucleotide reductase [Candidatus Microgenomates bacterium]|nr:vitamin B12-dependent ribonucleotide reductase [Candidatus Microgenomates bacterium]